jgi:DNA end-binding protein Ku
VRAIWKGAVSFGLVNVPVRLYSATENHDVQFRQVHREDGGRIRYQRVCSIDGEQVSYDDIAKGYETEDGQMVVLTDDDMAELPTRSSREIAVQKFVPADQIDPMVLDRSYYLEPDKTATKPYALLREALQAADRMAIVTVSIRARMTMAVLRVKDDVIVMQTMLWPDEIRSPEFANLDGEPEAKPAELAMANMLVESLAGDYEPGDYEDDYHAAVESLVQAKLEGGEVQMAPAARDTGGEVVDLLAALQRSVERAKTARGEPASQESEDADADEDEDAGEAEDADGDTAEADLAPEKPVKKAAGNRGRNATKKATAKKRAAG